MMKKTKRHRKTAAYPFCTSLDLKVLRSLDLNGPQYGLQLSRKERIPPAGLYSCLRRLTLGGHLEKVHEHVRDYSGRSRPVYKLTASGKLLVNCADKIAMMRARL
jgi:DNA-binding PadR family transcriptional regulator